MSAAQNFAQIIQNHHDKKDGCYPDDGKHSLKIEKQAHQRKGNDGNFDCFHSQSSLYFYELFFKNQAKNQTSHRKIKTNRPFSKIDQHGSI